MKDLLFIMSFPVFVYFNSSTNYLKTGSELESQFSSQKSSKVTYLFFKVEKNENGLEKVVLEGKNTSDGKLKIVPEYDRSEASIGDYVITLTNSAGKEIVKQSIEDPLNPVMEVFDENIERKQVSLKTAEFSIRYNHSDEISLLKVEKITNTGNQLLLNQKF